MKYVNFKEWSELINKLADRIQSKYPGAVGMFGVPKGGSIIVAKLSHLIGLPVLEKPVNGCVVVDDLTDSGKTKEKYKDYPFEVLIEKKDNEWITFWYENEKKDAEDLVTRFLEYIGENPNREGLKDTPKRVVKMWKEIFRGYNLQQRPKVTTFNNGSDGVIYNQMITDSGDFYSYCEHHCVPFMGKFFFGYIPSEKGKILGLSKVARIIDYYSAKLQIQERLVQEIVNDLWNELSKDTKYPPLGIGLYMEAEHLCKSMRGAKKKGKMSTCCLKGTFYEEDVKQEFMMMAMREI